MVPPGARRRATAGGRPGRGLLLSGLGCGRGDAPVLVPLTLPIKRARNRTRGPIGCTIERDEHIGVDVLNLNTLGRQSHVDLATLVYVATEASGIGEAKQYPIDPLAEAAQREAEAAFCTGSEYLGDVDVSPADLNLHLVLRRESRHLAWMFLAGNCLTPVF